ncbi:Macrophage mannose receptor 1 [Chionoecetes opilio]|uniref:Macrophage mannose receptor 1 n=1 Tax=Chionoecetes opilio TaxID=41210 RepID=A0A8J4XVA4_CHIOP|nr:Macrophage mannose receptor 1 [Chionoecetes opilio]
MDCATKLFSPSVWIGLNDMKEEIIFACADGSESKFTSWAQNEPNKQWSSAGEDCMEMRKVKDFRWNDKSCEQIRQFLCSTPAEAIPTVCEEGWYMFELSCYKVNNDKVTWKGNL